jgi:hypothetical protein
MAAALQLGVERTLGIGEQRTKRENFIKFQYPFLPP